MKLKRLYTQFILWLSKSYTIYILLSLVFFVFLIIAVISKKLNATDVIEFSAFSAVLLESALVALSNTLCKRLLNKIEDPSKLITEYDNLINIYKSSESEMIDGDDGKIPVVFVSWLYNKTIEIIDDPNVEYRLPYMVSRYYEQLFAAHQTSNIYNNINIRVLDWSVSDNKFIIKTGRTTYYDSLVTNRAMDLIFEKGMSVRQLYECGPMLRPLSLSKLSNHLGFNGFVESSDAKIALVFRQDNISIGKRTWGDSIGASLKTKYALENYSFTLAGLNRAIVSEINDELEITNEKISQFKILAAYRDLVEGGKPQLLFYCLSSLSKDEINKKFSQKNQTIKERKRKAKDLREQQEIEMETDGEKIQWIDKNDIKNNIEIRSDRIIHNGKTFFMMPSASACVALLRKYYIENESTQ
jgi:hypothetical protein